MFFAQHLQFPRHLDLEFIDRKGKTLCSTFLMVASSSFFQLKQTALQNLKRDFGKEGLCPKHALSVTDVFQGVKSEECTGKAFLFPFDSKRKFIIFIFILAFQSFNTI